MHPAFNIQDVKGSVSVALKGVRETQRRLDGEQIEGCGWRRVLGYFGSLRRGLRTKVKGISIKKLHSVGKVKRTMAAMTKLCCSSFRVG